MRLIALFLVLLVARSLVVEVLSLRAPIFGEHNWRQSESFATAWSFVHESGNFFLPRIDERDDLDGVMGMEPPIYAYLVSIFMRILGDGVPLARAIACGAVLYGLLSFARIVAREESRLHALGFATAAALSPLLLVESRAVQPDAFCAGLLLAAAASFRAYALTERRRDYVIGVVLATLGVLAKSPFVCALPAMWLFTIGPGRRLVSWRSFRLGLPIALVPIPPSIAWYRWALYLTHRHADGNTKFTTELKLESILPSLKSIQYREHIFRFIVPSYALAWVLLPAVVAGIYGVFTVRRHRALGVPMLAWLAGGLSLMLVAAERLWSHWYYATVIVMPLTYFAAVGLGTLLEAVRDWRRASTPQLAMAAAVASGLVAALLFAQLRPLVPAGSKELATVNSLLFTSPRGVLRLAALFPIAGVLVVVALRVRAFVPSLVPSAIVAVPLVGALYLAQRDAFAMIDYHDGLPAAWRREERDVAEMRTLADTYSTRQDIFIAATERNPYILHRFRRVGYVPEPDDLSKLGIGYFIKHGARFWLDESPANAPDGGYPTLGVAGGWRMRCIDPKGCSPRTPGAVSR